jgi:hypothetical protein
LERKRQEERERRRETERKRERERGPKLKYNCENKNKSKKNTFQIQTNLKMEKPLFKMMLERLTNCQVNIHRLGYVRHRTQ